MNEGEESYECKKEMKGEVNTACNDHRATDGVTLIFASIRSDSILLSHGRLLREASLPP